MSIRYNAYRRIWMLFFLIPGLAPWASVLAEKTPVEVLQDMSDHVMEIIKQDPSVLDDKARLRAIAKEVIIPNIDFIALSQSVLGVEWRRATWERERHRSSGCERTGTRRPPPRRR